MICVVSDGKIRAHDASRIDWNISPRASTDGFGQYFRHKGNQINDCFRYKEQNTPPTITTRRLSVLRLKSFCLPKIDHFLFYYRPFHFFLLRYCLVSFSLFLSLALELSGNIKYRWVVLRLIWARRRPFILTADWFRSLAVYICLISAMDDMVRSSDKARKPINENCISSAIISVILWHCRYFMKAAWCDGACIRKLYDIQPQGEYT